MLLYWAIIFAVVALIAGIFGFGGVASAAGGVARVLFFIFVLVFLVTAHTIYRSWPAMILSSALGIVGTFAAGAFATDYADQHIGSFADRNFSLFVAAAGFAGGLATVILCQGSIKWISRASRPDGNSGIEESHGEAT